MTLSKKTHVVLLLLTFLFFGAAIGYGLEAGKLKGTYHRVKKGETLYSIARAYHVHVQDLAEVNNIEDPGRIEKDRVIFVPEAGEVVEEVMLLLRAKDASAGRNKPAAEVKPETKTPPADDSAAVRKSPLEGEKKASEESSRRKTTALPSGKAVEETREAPKAVTPPPPQEEAAPSKSGTEQPPPVKSSVSPPDKEAPPTDGSGKLQLDKNRFVWPVKGRIISRFGIQSNGMYHNWISISAKEMAPVVAAAGGTVIFSAVLKDYGETIIIKHADHFATVYTHLKVRKVLLDDSVKKGEAIALVGKLGKEDNVYLNFEVRHQNRARNPLFFLP